MSETTFSVVMVPYMLLGILAWRLIYHRGATAARNYPILSPITALAFISVVRIVSGSLPSFLVLIENEEVHWARSLTGAQRPRDCGTIILVCGRRRPQLGHLDPIAFNESGIELAKALKNTLGPQTYVEYDPEQVGGERQAPVVLD